MNHETLSIDTSQTLTEQAHDDAEHARDEQVAGTGRYGFDSGVDQPVREQAAGRHRAGAAAGRAGGAGDDVDPMVGRHRSEQAPSVARRAVVASGVTVGAAATLAACRRVIPGLDPKPAPKPTPTPKPSAPPSASATPKPTPKPKPPKPSTKPPTPTSTPGPTSGTGTVGSRTGYAALAASVSPLGVPSVDVSDPARNLLRKATWGVRQSDMDEIKKQGIDGWIARQLDPDLGEGAGGAAWGAFPLAGAGIVKIRGSVKQGGWDAMMDTAMGSLARQIFSERQLFEIVVDVFANLLNVPIPGDVWSTGPDYHVNVIRKHAFGRYEDMLLAAMRHPAMLKYLTNVDSTRKHVNENLGRELLELHTVGIDAAYTEDHVKASARILSGRTADWKTDQYLFKADDHWIGPVKVLGFTHDNADANAGEEVGDQYLRYLANHPSTALTVAREIATRFVSDDPPNALVERLAQTYLDHDTEIIPVLDVMFRSREFWESATHKTRRPHEDLVATVRVLNGKPTDLAKTIEGLYWTLENSGQPPLGWPAPNGYPDVASAWMGSGSVLARWNTHRKVSYNWFKGLSIPAPDKMLAGTEAMTVAQFVDDMCVRLTGQKFSDKDRRALFSAAEIPADSAISWHAWQVSNAIVPLILDSIYFQVR